ncbi:hypothetical protein [Bacillus cereus]|uniref:hypothetical protein n=1 Tax=Bacillus cereus TaxID=1396 RepID=UPI000BF41AEC|nr:hypothetical protein [Bacillus cereus]PFT46233.1 hypothetical protein COK63_05290 [Bacillus cereus]
MEEKKFELNEEQKSVLLKALKDIHFANAQLREWVRKDSLSVEMSKTLPALIESYFSEASEVLDYESYLLEEKEKRYVEIKKANQTIHELQIKLGSEKPIDGLKEQLKFLSEIVRDWWNIEGFNHVNEIKYYPYGEMRVEFCFMLEHYRIYSKTPLADKRSRAEHIQYLRDQGFEFADFEKGRSEKLNLIDNHQNRTLLLEMLTERFPSIEVHSFSNHSSYSNKEVFIIRHIDASICNLADI